MKDAALIFAILYALVLTVIAMRMNHEWEANCECVDPHNTGEGTAFERELDELDCKILLHEARKARMRRHAEETP